MFQTPLDLNEFRTNDADALPLLHLIVHIVAAELNSPLRASISVEFLNKMITNTNPFINTNPTYGLNCTLTSSSGQKAGEMFPMQVTKFLCSACKKGDVRVVRGLLAAGTDINKCDECDKSPLMHASTHGKIDVINVLVTHGANVRFVNNEHKTSLALACQNKQWHAAVVLYQHIIEAEADMPADKRSNNDKAFQIALQHHSVRYLQYVAENDQDAYDALVSKLSFSDACKHGYDLVVKHHTLHHNYDQTLILDAVKIACYDNRLVVLHVLMPHLTNSSVSELITHAYQHHQYQCAHELFELCTDHSTLPCPRISVTDACKARQLDLVDFLIKHGKDVNKAADELSYLLKYVPGDAHALLHVWKATAEDKQRDNVMYSPAKVDESLSAVNDHNCHPPLVYACMQGDIAIVKLLLQHGADIDICSDETPLTAACKHGHEKVVDILLHNTPKPSICQTNMYGMTPLQVAVKHHQGMIARRLINSYRADPNACKPLDTEFIEVTLMGLMRSFSFVKFQAIAEDITNIVSEESNCWKIFLDPLKTEDAGTPPIVAAFQSKQYDLVKCFIDCSANYQPLFECATLEDFCQLESVLLVQEYIHNQLQTTEINYEVVLEVVTKLGNTDIMAYFLTRHQIYTRARAKALIQACQEGFHDMVHLLIQHDSCLVKSIQHDINHSYCHHPLCIAIRNSDVTMAVILYKSGAQLFNVSSKETQLHNTLCEDSLKDLCSRQDEFSDILPQLLPKAIDQSSLTSFLVAACKAGCTRAARLLVSTGADVNGCDEKGDTPICAAIRVRSSQLVALLLNKGAHPNTATQHTTALHIACEKEHFEIASMLIDAGADTNPESCSPLSTACEHNYIDIVELLLENRACPNWSSSKGHILNIAHSAKHYEVVRLLLEYGAEPTILRGIGLNSICELGYTEVAQHIIHESHVSPDVLEQCIEGAYKNGVLEATLEAIMDIREQDIKDNCIQLIHALLLGETLSVSAHEPPDVVSADMSLWRCLEKRNIARMRELIKGGHDVNIPNVTGRSLLQECIQQRITHVIPDLCASHIHIDHRDSAGRTALFYSVACPHLHTAHGESISVFEYLVSKDADVNVKDYFGRSVLHEWQPVSDGLKHGPSLETLLKHIDISSTDHKGQTALHLAVLNNNMIAVRQLLEHGANMGVHDINDITPVFLAHRNHAILTALQKNYPDSGYKRQNSPSGKEHHQKRVHMISDRSKQHRLVPLLKKVFHERAKYTQTDYFMSKFEAQVYYTMKRSICREKVLFEETVLQMLRAINCMVIQEEPVLSFTPRLSGSCAEGTKVIALDEADILCVFDDDSWQHITLSQASNDAHIQENPSYVQISSQSIKHQTLVNDKYFSKRKLLQRLYTLIRKALPTVLKNIKSLYMIDVKNAVANDHSLACLSLVWHGQELPWQEFTVDIVPAIPVTQEQLPDVTRNVMSYSHIMQDLFVVPKTGSFDQSQSDAAFRLSFSSTEKDLFLAMPAALKQGYMLTKVLMHDCITIDNIPSSVCSYNLKTATFECFKSETPHWQDLVKESHKTVTVKAEKPEDVVRWAQNILQEVEHSFLLRHQDSFFIQGSDLMLHNIDKNDYRQMLYVKYCAVVLSNTNEAAWQQLADCVAQQLLKSENNHNSCFLHEIKTLVDMGLKSQPNDILFAMIELGSVEGVRMMLERGASITDLKLEMTAFNKARYLHVIDETTRTPMLNFLENNVKGKFIIHLYVILET